MSATTNFEYHELDESDDTVSQESCEEEVTPNKLEFNDDILSIEHESFSCGFDVNVGLDVNLCAEYEYFSFALIHLDFLFESHKYEFVESEAIVLENFNLDQSLLLFDIIRLVDFAPTILPRLFAHDNLISRTTTIGWLV